MKQSKYLSTIITVIVMVFIILFLVWATVIRDYTFSNVGGRWQFVARITVPVPSGLTVDTSEEERLTVKCSNLGSKVHSYEFQISPFKNMAFAKVYGTAVPRQTIAGLKGGKKYYIRVRAVKLNPSGRRVHGSWSSVHVATAKKKQEEKKKR
ncbi:MAG: hypothetical protein IJT32_01330 [Lachnospiraceae bacterium]|nr:hypothetical protein [Lachnospiraceae bacterium]